MIAKACCFAPCFIQTGTCNCKLCRTPSRITRAAACEGNVVDSMSRVGLQCTALHFCNRPQIQDRDGTQPSVPYLLLPVSGKSMKLLKTFIRVRLSSHSLPNEAGRHHRLPIPRSFRFCPHCALSSVEMEYQSSCLWVSNVPATSLTPLSNPEPLHCSPSPSRRIIFLSPP